MDEQDLATDGEPELSQADIIPEASAPEEAPRETARESVTKAYEKVKSEVSGLTEEEAAERARDTKGRFAKAEKPQTDLKTSTPAKAVATGQVSGQPSIEARSGVTQPQVATPTASPASWPAEVKAAVEKLPPAARDFLANRESQLNAAFTQKTQQVAKAARGVEGVLNAVAPYQEKFARQGRETGQVVSTMLAWQEHLNKDPVAGVFDMMSDLGISLDHLITKHNGDIDSGTKRPVDPRYQELEQKVQTFEQRFSEQEKQREALEVQRYQNLVKHFGGEVDGSGQPLRPHFESVRSEMVPFVEYLQRANPSLSDYEALTQAYERAVLVNPQVRTAIEQGKAQAENAQRLEQIKAKTIAAKRAGSMISGSPAVNGKIRSQGGSVRDDVIAAFRSRQ